MTAAGVRAEHAEAVATENFPVAMRLLPGEVRSHLLAVYDFARHVDDLGDAYAGDRAAALARVADDVAALYDGGAVGTPEVAELRHTVETVGLPAAPLLRLIEANLQDQHIASYPTFADLLDYCRLSANPVGEAVLHVFGCADPQRIEMSDRICTALQLLEHWQDVGEDRRAGRVYLPTEDLARFGVTPQDLDGPRATPGLRALLAFETDRALAWLNAGAPLVSTLRGWARLAVSGYVAGGRAAAAELVRSDFEVLSEPPKPRRRQLAAQWLLATLRSPG